MPRQTQTKPKPQPTARTDATETETVPAPAATSSTSATAADLLDSDLLDEIDAVLEENAMEVVKRYIQKGGE